MLNIRRNSDNQFDQSIIGFCDSKISNLLICMGCIPIIFGFLINIISTLLKTKHTTLHTLEGLLPVVLLVSGMYSIFATSKLSWSKPVLPLVLLSPYFCLTTIRLIISTVTKQKFTIFIDKHLTFPFLLTILIFPAKQYFGWKIDDHYIYF